MKGTKDARSILSVAGDVKTAAISLNWQSSASSNRQARNASASSRESAATTKGLSLGLSSHAFNVLRYAAIEGAKISGVRLGSLALAHRRHTCSMVSYPLTGRA